MSRPVFPPVQLAERPFVACDTIVRMPKDISATSHVSHPKTHGHLLSAVLLAFSLIFSQGLRPLPGCQLHSSILPPHCVLISNCWVIRSPRIKNLLARREKHVSTRYHGWLLKSTPPLLIRTQQISPHFGTVLALIPIPQTKPVSESLSLHPQTALEISMLLICICVPAST